MGERKASGFLKKFYGWYLGRGRFPRPFKNELVVLDSTDEVVERLLAAAPGAAEVLERLEAEQPPVDDRLLELPVSIYGGGRTWGNPWFPPRTPSLPTPTRYEPLRGRRSESSKQFASSSRGLPPGKARLRPHADPNIQRRNRTRDRPRGPAAYRP